MQFVLIALVAFFGLASAFTVPSSRCIGVKIATSTALDASIRIVPRENEPVEDLLKRFKKASNQSGHLRTMRDKEKWESTANKKKRKLLASRMAKSIERANDRYENSFEY